MFINWYTYVFFFCSKSIFGVCGYRGIHVQLVDYHQISACAVTGVPLSVQSLIKSHTTIILYHLTILLLRYTSVIAIQPMKHMILIIIVSVTQFPVRHLNSLGKLNRFPGPFSLLFAKAIKLNIFTVIVYNVKVDFRFAEDTCRSPDYSQHHQETPDIICLKFFQKEKRRRTWRKRSSWSSSFFYRALHYV